MALHAKPSGRFRYQTRYCPNGVNSVLWQIQQMPPYSGGIDVPHVIFSTAKIRTLSNTSKLFCKNLSLHTKTKRRRLKIPRLLCIDFLQELYEFYTIPSVKHLLNNSFLLSVCSCSTNIGLVNKKSASEK